MTKGEKIWRTFIIIYLSLLFIFNVAASVLVSYECTSIYGALIATTICLLATFATEIMLIEEVENLTEECRRAKVNG